MSTSLKTFYVTVWDHSLFRATIPARTPDLAIETAEGMYAAAIPAECEGFLLLDNHGDEWDAVPAPREPRKRRPS